MMRVGKKPTVVEAKKTRSCFVRLEKVPPAPAANKVTRASLASAGSSVKIRASPTQDDKKYNGPIKKRPITQLSSPTAPATPRAKQPQKIIMKPEPESIIEEHIQTIAAGRSRRAIKPNPKYSSEDIVTPKIVKNVAALGSTSLNKKLHSSVEKHGIVARTSLEDFFNRESSDEMGDAELDDFVDKAFKVNAKESDSDFSDMHIEEPPRIVRKRGRPRKVDPQTQKANADAGSPAVTVKATATTIKSTPSQLQQLRKSLSHSVNRVTETPPTAKKRKMEDSDNGHFELSRKRFVVAASGYKYNMSTFESDGDDSNGSLTTRKSLISQKLNGNKTEHSKVLEKQTTIIATIPAQDNKKEKMLTADKLAANATAAKPLAARTLQSVNAQNKNFASPKLQSLAGKQHLQSQLKQRSASPALPRSVKSTQENEEKTEDSLSSNADDSEATPTFTIVNINDIINKKGDALISKTANKNVANKPKVEAPKSTIFSKASPPGPEIRVGRRKTLHESAVTEQIVVERSTKIPPRTSISPKKAPTILNHIMFNKSSNQRSPQLSTSFSPEKPVPRILNSMVAKKTQPVKPMITNMDDSADESFPLSLDEDEEEEAEEMDEDDDGAEEEDEETEDQQDVDASFTSAESSERPHKTRNSTPYAAVRKTVATTVAKENLLTDSANNRITPKPAQSSEKVVISKQGDKIIKKITCFETWFVINVPEDRPLKLTRNTIDIPLVKLANSVKEIALPSETWNTKVTLNALSPSTLAKTTRNLVLYTGDLKDHHITEADRAKYMPSCLMIRRTVYDRTKSRLPFDRAVIFKNKTFYTNIDGKNVRLRGAPTHLSSYADIEILLEILDELTMDSPFVELTDTGM